MQKLLIAGLLLMINAFGNLAWAEPEVFSTGEGAIRGYDPVAYFNQAQPVKGQMDITFDHNGATWHFVNTANRDLFASDPEKYAPQYGGYCAYGLSKGYLVPTDPQAWEIHQGKLYLNYSLPVRTTWQKDIPGYLQQSEANWKTQTFN